MLQARKFQFEVPDPQSLQTGEPTNGERKSVNSVESSVTVESVGIEFTFPEVYQACREGDIEFIKKHTTKEELERRGLLVLKRGFLLRRKKAKGHDVKILEKLCLLAVRCGHRNIVAYLVNRGKVNNLTGRSSKGKKIAKSAAYQHSDYILLHQAVTYGHVDVVEYLLEYRCDVNELNLKGEHALIRAARTDAPPSVVRCLLHAKADILHKGGTAQLDAVTYAMWRHNSQLMKAIMKYYDKTAAREDMCSDNVLTHRFSGPLGLTLRGWTISSVGPGAARKKRIKKGWSIRDINGARVPDDTAVIKLMLATARDIIRVTFYKKRPPNDHWEALLARAVRNEKLIADVTFTKSVLGIRLSGRVVTFVDPKGEAAEKGVRPGWKVNMVDGHLMPGDERAIINSIRLGFAMNDTGLVVVKFVRGGPYEDGRLARIGSNGDHKQPDGNIASGQQGGESLGNRRLPLRLPSHSNSPTFHVRAPSFTAALLRDFKSSHKYSPPEVSDGVHNDEARREREVVNHESNENGASSRWSVESQREEGREINQEKIGISSGGGEVGDEGRVDKGMWTRRTWNHKNGAKSDYKDDDDNDDEELLPMVIPGDHAQFMEKLKAGESLAATLGRQQQSAGSAACDTSLLSISNGSLGKLQLSTNPKTKSFHISNIDSNQSNGGGFANLLPSPDSAPPGGASLHH